MEFRIADTFTDSIAKLSGKTKTAASRLGVVNDFGDEVTKVFRVE